MPTTSGFCFFIVEKEVTMSYKAIQVQNFYRFLSLSVFTIYELNFIAFKKCFVEFYIPVSSVSIIVINVIMITSAIGITGLG